MRVKVQLVALILLLVSGVVACNDSNAGLQAGRFQLLLVEANDKGEEQQPYLLDTATGRVWRKLPTPDNYNYWSAQFHPDNSLINEDR